MSHDGDPTEQAPRYRTTGAPCEPLGPGHRPRSSRATAALRASAVAAAILGVTAAVQVCRADALWEAQAWADAFLPLQGAQTPVREVIDALPFL